MVRNHLLKQKNKMLSKIRNKKVISLIGMAKNVGKTTTLNYLIRKLTDKTLGLTSIGRDGELRDLTLDIPKPRIYINKGTLIATTTACLELSDFTKQILDSTGIITPLGEVVIVRCLSDGYVELAGPSINIQLKKIVELLQKYGGELILIDGAINRKTVANIDVSEATILCTGASYSSNLDKVIDDTTHIVKLLSLPEVDKSFFLDFKDILNKVKVAYIFKDNSIKFFNIPTIINKAEKIIDKLNSDVRFLLVNGALTDDFLNKLWDKRYIINDLTIVTKHGVNYIFNKDIFNKFKDVNIDFKVLKKIDILCLTINPNSPYGYQFNEKEFKDRLKKNVEIQVFNVMSDKL